MNPAVCFFDKRSYFESNVCRLCASARDKVLPIFDTSGSKFDAKIRDCLHCLNIQPGDGKPQQLCLECITKLNTCYEFLQICMRSDVHFDFYIRNHTLKDQLEKTPGNSLQNSQLNSGNTSLNGLTVPCTVDRPLPDSLQDLLVVVELKYKDGAQSTSGKLQLNRNTATSKPDVEWNRQKTIIQHNLDNNGDVQNCSTTGDNQPPITSKFEKKELECAVCQKKFNKTTRLNAHMACHSNNRPYTCEQCGKSFAMKWDLNVHLRIHKKDIVCATCDKAFSCQAKLQRHVRVHTGEKPFSCTFCGKDFGDKRNLDNHLRIHSGAKPYPCSECGKAFSVRSHMVEHLNVHKKTASYSCALCDKSFRFRANYSKHLKTHSFNDNG